MRPFAAAVESKGVELRLNFPQGSFFTLFIWRNYNHENDISAQEQTAQAGAWLEKADGICRRPQGSEETDGKGSSQADCLNI